jgi:cytidylate kinase
VGSLLARKLGYIFFDTGMMYRAFTWKVLKLGISPENEKRLSQLASITKFDFVPSREGYLSPLIDGENVSSKLLYPEIEEQVSLISKVAGLRQTLVSEQRRLAKQGKVVMAGRDIGTVVLPWAELKIFLVASAEERANRRYKELLEQGKRIDYNAIFADLKRRDEIDTHRSISPLKPATDAVVIDTEKLSLEQVVDKIYALAVT